MTALLIAEPLETLDFLGAQTTSGTVSVVAAPDVRLGRYAMRANPTAAAAFANWRGRAATGADADLAATTIYVSFLVYTGASAPTVQSTLVNCINAAGTSLARMVHTTSNTIVCQYTNGSDVGTTVVTISALAANTLYLFEMALVNTSTAGSSSVEFRLNGVVQGSASSLTILSGGSRQVDRVRPGYSVATTVDTHYGRIYAASDGYPGVLWTDVLKPTSDATNTMTSGTYADLDEMDGAVNDGDTTFVGDATSGHLITCNFEQLSGRSATGSIVAVAAVAVVRDEGGASSLQGRLVSGATTDDWTAIDPGATYRALMRIYNTDPNTGAAWTPAGVNAIKFGIVNAASVAIRVTALSLWVIYRQDALLVNGGLVNRGLVNGGLIDA